MKEREDLRSTGLKVTLPRIKVLEIFRSVGSKHLNAEGIYRLLMDQGSDIGLATIYRVLTQLEEAGILARNTFNTGRTVYELNLGKHHDHMICLDCGRTDEFCDPTIEKHQRTVAVKLGYVLEDHRLALYGYCPDCVTKRSKT